MFDLVLCNKHSLRRLHYHQEDSCYAVTNSLKLSQIGLFSKDSSITHILQSQSTIFVVATKGSDQVKVVSTTSDLTIRQQRKFMKTGRCLVIGAAVYQGHLIISVNGKLLVLDSDLNTIGEVSLLGIKKNADHILLHNNIAYLLDDVVEPLAIFKVDLTQLDQPRILETGFIKCVNGRLVGQWLEPSLGLWQILESYAVQSESGTNIHVLPMTAFMELLSENDWSTLMFPNDKESEQIRLPSLSDETIDWDTYWERSGMSPTPGMLPPIIQPVRSLSKQTIYRREQFLGDGTNSIHGHQVLAVTPLPPIWALVQDANQKLYLSQLCSENQPSTGSLSDFPTSYYTIFEHCLELSAFLPPDAPPHGQRQGREFWQYSGTIQQVEHFLFILFTSTYGAGWESTSFQDSRLVVVNLQDEPQVVLNQACPVKQAYPLLACID